MRWHLLSLTQEKAGDLYSVRRRDDGREENTDSVENESLSLHDLLSTDRLLLGVSFITSFKSNLCTALTTQNTTESNCIISHAHNTTALQPNVFLTENNRFVTNTGRSPFFSANCQGQLQASQSVSVPVASNFILNTSLHLGF
jgi:hypothetical protein